MKIMTKNTTPERFLVAYRVFPDGGEFLGINTQGTVTSLQSNIVCDHFDVLALNSGIDMFVDDEGSINGSPLNFFATYVAHTFGIPAVLFGNAVMLGINPDTGDSISLTEAQLDAIVAALNDCLDGGPDTDTMSRVFASMGPNPDIHEMLGRRRG